MVTLNNYSTCEPGHPIHRQRDCPPVFFDLAAEQIGPLAVDHVAEAVVGCGEKGGFHNTGFIFEG